MVIVFSSYGEAHEFSGGSRILLRGYLRIKNAREFLKPRPLLHWPRPLAIKNGVF